MTPSRQGWLFPGLGGAKAGRQSERERTRYREGNYRQADQRAAAAGGCQAGQSNSAGGSERAARPTRPSTQPTHQIRPAGMLAQSKLMRGASLAGGAAAAGAAVAAGGADRGAGTGAPVTATAAGGSSACAGAFCSSRQRLSMSKLSKARAKMASSPPCAGWQE